MKIQNIAIATLAAGALALASCNDYLDKVPDTRVELTTPEQLRLLLVDGYSSADIAPVLEISSDNVEDNNSTGPDGARYPYASFDPMQDEAYQWQEIKSSLSTNSPSDAWEGYYHAIAVANAVLEAIPEMEANGLADKVAPYKGEALMIRAYNHFQLANIFCEAYRGPELSKSVMGIPYAEKPETTVKPQYDRGNLADVYDKIERDILAGLPLINDDIYEQPKYHFNRAAAHAFAARFFLFKRDYAKCDSLASIAITDNPDILMNTLWSQNFPGSTYYAQYNFSETNPHNFLITATHSLAQRWISNGRYTCSRHAEQATFRGYGPTWPEGETGYVCHPCFSGKIYQYDTQGVRRFFVKQVEMFEYTDKIARTGFAHVVRTDFTIEETLLCRAEARLFLGDEEGCLADLQTWDNPRWNCTVTPRNPQPALTYARIKAFYRDKDPGHGIVKPLNIDKVYPYPGYNLSEKDDRFIDILQCVLHFRRIENIYDGSRWFDVKRYGIELEHQFSRYDIILTLPWDDPRRALQIPPDVLSAGFTPNKRISLEPTGGETLVSNLEVK